jgi:hypothetical protein
MAIVAGMLGRRIMIKRKAGVDAPPLLISKESSKAAAERKESDGIFCYNVVYTA